MLAGDGWEPPWTKDDPDRDWRVDDVPLAEIVADYELAVEESNAVTAKMGLADPAARPRSPEDRVKVGNMLRSLGREDVYAVVKERGVIVIRDDLANHGRLTKVAEDSRQQSPQTYHGRQRRDDM